MADADLNLSRRALLGAAFAAPVAVAGVVRSTRHPGLDPGSTFFSSPVPSQIRWMPDQVRHDEMEGKARAGRREARWSRALGAYRAAEAELKAYERRMSGAPWEEQAAIEEAHGALSDRMYDSLRRLLKAAAPDLAAVAVKLDLVVEHEVGTLTGGETCFAALRRDVSRLSRALGLPRPC